MKSISYFFFCFFIAIEIQAQDLYFPPNFSEEWETMSLDELDWCAENVEDFSAFLEETNTNACIILKDGKIAHESYYNDFDLASSWYWASAGKSLTAAMIGILQEEGALDIDDRTSEYLGDGWTNCDQQDEDNITIRHQLTMTTGIDHSIIDVYCIDPECLDCEDEPGEEWYYNNPPYTLLSNVIESATDQTYTGVTNSKLTNKIGFIGLWTVVESGRLFFSTARGMARFGLLMLNNGDWDNEEILKDKDYIQEMINTSQDINKSYGYLWWLNGKESFRIPGSTITFPGKIIPEAPDDMYAAIGKNGQVLMVIPSQNLIVVRMGNNPDNSLVPTSYVNDLWNEYAKLSCSVSTENIEELEFSIKPKLVFNKARVISNEDFDIINVFDLKGNKLMASKSKVLDLEGLARGMYFIQVQKGNKSGSKKIIKI